MTADDPWRAWLSPTSPLSNFLTEADRRDEQRSSNLIAAIQSGAAQTAGALENQRAAQEVMASIVLASAARTNSTLSTILDVLSSPSETVAREHIRRGVRAFREGWDEDAVEEFTRAIEADRYIAVSHFYLGLLRERGGALAAAASYTSAIKYGRSDRPLVASAALRLLAISDDVDPALMALLRQELATCPEFLVALGARTGDVGALRSAIDLAPEIGADIQVLGLADVDSLLRTRTIGDSLLDLAEAIRVDVARLMSESNAALLPTLPAGSDAPERLAAAALIVANVSAILDECQRLKDSLERRANQSRTAASSHAQHTESLRNTMRQLEALEAKGRAHATAESVVSDVHRQVTLDDLRHSLRLVFDEMDASVLLLPKPWSQLRSEPPFTGVFLEPLAPVEPPRVRSGRPSPILNYYDRMGNGPFKQVREEVWPGAYAEGRALLMRELGRVDIDALERQYGATLSAVDHNSFTRHSFPAGWSHVDGVSDIANRLVVMRDALLARSEEIVALHAELEEIRQRLDRELAKMRQVVEAQKRVVVEDEVRLAATVTGADSEVAPLSSNRLEFAADTAKRIASRAASRIRPFVA